MKKLFIFLLVVAVMGLAFWLLQNNKTSQTNPPEEIMNYAGPHISYTDTDYDITFDYPIMWADPIIKSGNHTCPEEDTYRTPDTLNVFDREISFPDLVLLPNSESFIRAGVRIYEFDPKKLNDCGDELFLGLASKEFDGRALSSVLLTPVELADFFGYRNESASRLNTEGREQYIFFSKTKSNPYLVIQPYISFIPYFGSPELAELENDFAGDMQAYIEKGYTAMPIREYRQGLEILAKSLKISDEITLNDGTYCYHRSQVATPDAPYSVEEDIMLVVNGNNVTGTKSGTQSGPDMTNGFEGTLTGTRNSENLDLVFAYTVEGSENKEQELYKWTPAELQKSRYVLKESNNILVPDTTSIPTILHYQSVKCAS